MAGKASLVLFHVPRRRHRLPAPSVSPASNSSDATRIGLYPNISTRHAAAALGQYRTCARARSVSEMS
eukprot:875359-Rhodomonas_salina.3